MAIEITCSGVVERAQEGGSSFCLSEEIFLS